MEGTDEESSGDEKRNGTVEDPREFGHSQKAESGVQQMLRKGSSEKRPWFSTGSKGYSEPGVFAEFE